MGTRQRLCSAIVFCIAAVLSGVTGSSAAVLQVCGSGCAFTSIQAAIDAAAGGDTVQVADGVYVELVDFKGKAVTVRSVNGPARTTIDGNGLGSVVTFAAGEGGGSVLDGFTVRNGRSASGAGIRCAGASPAIRHCRIRGNSATATGGGISCASSSPVIENCTVSGNYSAQYGGGIHCKASAPAITNCTVSGNFAGIEGGGIYCDGSSTDIAYCTIAGNSANTNGGGLYTASGAPSVMSSILWGNTAPWGDGYQIYRASGSVGVDTSDIQGGWAATPGNIDADPLFAAPRPASEAPTAAGDYRIAPASPCVDAGATAAPSSDISGDPRPQGGGYDIGSDEVALLANGSFEDGVAPLPRRWQGRLLSPRDAKVSTARTGFASFQMVGSTTGKELVQKFAFAGAAGDDLDLACWHKVSRASAGGAFFGATLTVFHADGTTATHRLPFTTETHAWRQGRRVFSAAKRYTAVKVSLIYANRTGRAWFDDVRLSIRR